MFVKSRVLYIVSSQKCNANLIYNDLVNSNILTAFFPQDNTKKISEGLKSFLNSLPDGTIFSKTVSLYREKAVNYYISLPFFSSHVKMPIKCGEHVWIYRYLDQTSLVDLYTIKSYWLSRVHALNFAEDVNYTYNDRDFTSINQASVDLFNLTSEGKKAKEKLEYDSFLFSNANNMIKPPKSFGEITFELTDTEEIYLKKSIKDYPKGCIPVVNKNPDDFILQGSNNTLIRLATDNTYENKYTKNVKGSGEITISAGIGKFAESDYTPITGLFFNLEGDLLQDQEFLLSIPTNLNLPTKLYSDGNEENILNYKVYNPYYYKNLDTYKNIEGSFNILEDASRISISESNSLDAIIHSNFSPDLNLNIENKNLNSKKFNSNLLNENKEYVNNFYSKSYRNINSLKSSPTINIVTSNLNLHSRNDQEGSIKISKEYFSNELNLNLNAYFRINQNGDAFIDANRIFIGNYSLYEKKKKTIDKSSGKDNYQPFICLGESKNSQNLVLGNQLKEYLKEILDVNREDMDKTKDLFRATEAAIDNRLSTLSNNLKNEVINSISSTGETLSLSLSPLTSGPAAAAPVTGLQAASAVSGAFSAVTVLAANIVAAIEKSSIELKLTSDELKSAINKAKMKRDEELSQRLKSIEDNIDKILSKISKTS